jgi:hypothetical protein
MLEAVSVSDVINFRLELVITPSGLIRFRSSSPSRVYADYYFHAVGCFEQLYLNMQVQSVFLGGDAQLLLVASSRLKAWLRF